MSTSLVFPTSSFQQQLLLLPKQHGPSSSYSTCSSRSSFLYKTALTSSSSSSTSSSSSSSSSSLKMKTIRGSTTSVAARAVFFSTVSSSNSNSSKKIKLVNGTVAQASMKRSSATAAAATTTTTTTILSKVPSAPTVPAHKTLTLPKLLPASLPLQVAVGMASACYWRGMWYILDDQLYPQDGAKSALASLALGTVGLAVSQPFLFDTTHGKKDCFQWPKTETLCRTTIAKKWLALYGLGTSCILIWRGAWVGCDVVYEKLTNENPLEPKHLTISGLASHGLALVGLIAMGRLHCVLGPPYHGSLTYKDEDMLNTSKKNLRQMARRHKRASLVLPALEQGSTYYTKVMQWLPEKAFSVRKI